MGGPRISFPAGWALNLWLNCVETAQQCRLLFAAMEEECWHPLGHTCCVVPDSTGKKSLCKLPRTGPWTTCNTFPIYLFHCFFVLILTYFEKGKNNKRKGFFQPRFVESDCISFHKAEAGAACTVGAAPLCGRWMMAGDVQLCLVDVMNTITSPWLGITQN